MDRDCSAVFHLAASAARKFANVTSSSYATEAVSGISLDVKNDAGKLTGHLQSGQASYDITEGNFRNGTLSLGFGKQAMLTAKVDGDKITGELVVGTEKKTIELNKATAQAPAASAAAVPASGTVDLNGQWDAVADANGQPFPFLLILKIDGESVSGSSSSQLGDSTIKTGTWKDGKLAISLEGQNGTIALSAIVVEGKLSGEFDYAGQLQGKWVAIKKN